MPPKAKEDEEGEEGEEGDAPTDRGIPECGRAEAVAEGDAFDSRRHERVVRGQGDLKADASDESRG